MRKYILKSFLKVLKIQLIARPLRKIHIPEVLIAMLNVDQSGCELLPISPGSSSRVTRQTKEDPGNEVAK